MRGGTIRDPFGHRWFVQTAIEADDVPSRTCSGRRYGDVGYLTLLVADGERGARASSAALFDWQLERRLPAGRVPHLVDHPAGGHRQPARDARRSACTSASTTSRPRPRACPRARRRGALGHRLRLRRQRRVRRRPGPALRPLPAQARLLRRQGGLRRSAMRRPDTARGGAAAARTTRPALIAIAPSNHPDEDVARWTTSDGREHSAASYQHRSDSTTVIEPSSAL